jgi:hypothetical protein
MSWRLMRLRLQVRVLWTCWVVVGGYVGGDVVTVMRCETRRFAKVREEAWGARAS